MKIKLCTRDPETIIPKLQRWTGIGIDLVFSVLFIIFSLSFSPSLYLFSNPFDCPTKYIMSFNCCCLKKPLTIFFLSSSFTSLLSSSLILFASFSCQVLKVIISVWMFPSLSIAYCGIFSPKSSSVTSSPFSLKHGSSPWEQK